VLVISNFQSGGDESAGRVAPAPPERDLPVVGPRDLAGYARDVNLNAVPDATIRVTGTGIVTRTDDHGRYELSAPRGDTTLVAEHPGYVRDDVTLTSRPPGGRMDFSLAATRPAADVPDSGHRLIFWAACGDIAALSRQELDSWIELGLDGFVCSTGRLEVTGGDHAWSVDPGTDLAGASFSLQRRLRSSAAVRMAKAGQLKLYLGFYASNGLNTRTPYEEWFDDEAWSGKLLPAVRELAGAARSLGFAGVAIDQELYPRPSNTEASWEWNYSGNQRPEHQVREQVATRGRQVMTALLEGSPGLEVVAYDTEVPESWSEKVQEVLNNSPDAYKDDVRINFWDGMSSVPGYSAIHWLDATFYKTPHVGNDWDAALRYNANGIYSVLSRSFSNWPYASSRLHVSPFSWIDAGLTEFQSARPPDYVAEQLDAFSRWGTGGMLANYDYSEFAGFDYGPYAAALKKASSPAQTDSRPPRLLVGSPTVGQEIELSGTATSPLAIRSVRWYDSRGRFGTAEVKRELEGGDFRAPGAARMNWSLRGVPAPRGVTRLTIVAEDIKGLATTRTLTIRP
jgi:hypothetical protein